MLRLSTLGTNLQVSPCNDVKAGRVRLAGLNPPSIARIGHRFGYFRPQGELMYCVWRQWIYLVFSMHVSCLPCANWNINVLNILEKFFIAAWDSQCCGTCSTTWLYVVRRFRLIQHGIVTVTCPSCITNVFLMSWLDFASSTGLCERAVATSIVAGRIETVCSRMFLACFHFCCSREFNPNFIPEFIFLLEQEGLEQRQKQHSTPFVVVLGV